MAEKRDRSSAPRREGRPAIILSDHSRSWVSCQSIVPNLLKAYRSAFANDLNLFYQRPDISDLEILRLAKDIALSRPERVVFLDHWPQPRRLIVALNMAWDRQLAPPIYIHLYGDMTRLSPEWWHLNSSLIGHNIQLICASDRQALLVSRLLAPRSGQVATCPFPVDKTKFNYFPQLRASARKKLSVLPDERVFLYSGRVNSEKGVAFAAKAFLSATNDQRIPSRMLIAGKIDDEQKPVLINSLGQDAKPMDWPEFLESLGPGERKRIQYLGFLPPEELVAIYNASDIGLSLSMYHCEDYGMAPAEALCTGSRMIISSWGGYASFKDAIGHCSTIPVHLSRTPPISAAAVRNEIKRQLLQPLDSDTRTNISAEFCQRFSIDAVSQVIRGIHSQTPPRFPGFGARMYQLAIRSLAGRNGIAIFPEGRKANTFYAEVFGAYYDEGPS